MSNELFDDNGIGRRIGVSLRIGLATVSIVAFGILETARAEGAGSSPTAMAAKPKTRTAAIEVVSEDGRPVPGAEVALVGLRAKTDPGSYYGLSEAFKNQPGVKTDAKGKADLGYPEFVGKELATGTLVVTVSHPEFCTGRVELPLGERMPIVLKAGRQVVLKAHLPGENEPLDRLCADVGLTFTENSPWKKVEGGISARLSDAIRSVRAVAFDENNVPLFSAPVEIGRGEGRGGTLNLEVRKGTELKGRLSAEVPRPVVNGRVVAEVATPSPDGESIRFLWNTGGAIDASGDFVLKNLPEGTVKLVALCDGFVSRSPADEKRQWLTVRAAQSFSEDRSKIAEVSMERSGIAKVTVLIPEGKPAANATVSFWPNQSFDSGTSLFGRIVELGDYLRAQQWGGPEAVAKLQIPDTRFSAVTDAGGVATIKELPGGPQNFGIEAAGMEMPILKDEGHVPRRWGHIGIKSGETSAQTIRMEPKGATSLSRAMEAYQAAHAKAKEEQAVIEPAPSLREPRLFQIRAVAEKPSASTESFTDDHNGRAETLALEQEVLLDLSAVKSFEVERNEHGTTILFTLTGAGREKFAEITARYLKRRIAFLAEGKLLIAPFINEKILGGKGSLGNVPEPEATELVKRLNAAIADRLPTISGTAANRGQGVGPK